MISPSRLLIYLSSLTIMRPHNYRDSLSTYPYHLPNPINILTKEFARHSFTTTATIPLCVRYRFAKNSQRLSSISIQTTQHVVSFMNNQSCGYKKPKTATLKQKLIALQEQVSKGKKRLLSFSNSICPYECEEQPQLRTINQLQDDIKQEDTCTTLSILNEVTYITSKITVRCYSQIKTYYLSNIPSAIEGKNSRALQHLILSHKIVKNQSKIQTPTFQRIEKHKVNILRDKSDANKKTLLIDIDETLIHCQQDASQPYDIALPVELDSGDKVVAYVSIRPYAISFLKKMAKCFEIITFTASHQSYADAILDEIDPQKEYIKHRLYRRSCIEIYQNIYAKDLRIVNRDLSSLVLVDNAPFSYIYQLENGIPIVPYYGGQDNELIQLQKYLEQVSKCGDVRELNKKTFKLHQYNNYNDFEELVRNLYLNHF